VTLKILGECIFGTNFSNELYEGRRPLDSFQYIMKNLSSDIAMLFPWYCYLPTKGHRELSAKIKHIRKYLYYLTEESKKDFDPKTMKAKNLVQLLIREKAFDKMSKESVIDNAVMFLSGGHETTTVTLALTVYLIGKHPEVQKKLHEEVDAFIANGELNYSSKKDLKLLLSCVKECVRLYPPIAMLVPRTATKDTQLGDIFVPKGTNIQINAWKIHYDEKNFPNPTAFVPERWWNRDLMESKTNRLAFYGFAEGKRTCIGKEFSQVESAIFLVNLLKLYEIIIPEDSFVKFGTDSILLIPDSNLKVIFKART